MAERSARWFTDYPPTHAQAGVSVEVVEAWAFDACQAAATDFEAWLSEALDALGVKNVFDIKDGRSVLGRVEEERDRMIANLYNTPLPSFSVSLDGRDAWGKPWSRGARRFLRWHELSDEQKDKVRAAALSASHAAQPEQRDEWHERDADGRTYIVRGRDDVPAVDEGGEDG